MIVSTYPVRFDTWRLHQHVVQAVALLILFCTSSEAQAGPLYDPFVERFDVGALSDPQGIELAAGLPSGLLEPARLDPNWWRAARAVTDTSQPVGAVGLARRLLDQVMTRNEADGWLAERHALLAQLRPGGPLQATDPDSAADFLLSERLTLTFFHSIRDGDLERARQIAERLHDGGAEIGLNDREIFVWYLRRLLLDKFLSRSGEIAPGFWDELRDLGSYDASNAWAIWVAHRRHLDRPILPQTLDDRSDGLFLGRLYKGWIDADELQAAALPPDVKAGLGAGLLSRDDLGRHFMRYPDPPADFTLQGWWVQGKRRYYRGDAKRYEGLAGRSDLKAGWTLDLWRRASERRLLKNEWAPGLADLDRALDLARQDRGTRAQRRRLRHWVEQALALAVAQGDTAGSREILARGATTFTGEAGEVYADEVAYWRHVLDGGRVQDYVAGAGQILSRASRVVEAGLAPTVQPATDTSRVALVAAADRPLWDLWFKWGRALANVDGLPPDRQVRADAYRSWLADGAKAATDEEKITAVLAAVAGRLAGRPELDELLDVALDLDIQRAGHCLSPPRPSAVPRLLDQLRGSQLDMHALLGFALVSGDMRGTLAVASVLPGTGLTLNEKLRFLYPLPPAGAVRRALLEADSEAALLLAVARNESLFEPAVRSRAGALGWMQIMPFHYDLRGAHPGSRNWRCPAVSVAAGDRLLEENRRRFDGDPYLTLAAYNAGPGAAERWRRQLGGQPSADAYLAWIGYTETRRYVEKVLIDRYVYDWIIGGQHPLPPATD